MNEPKTIDEKQAADSVQHMIRRRVIQIAVAGTIENSETQSEAIILLLCDDGSVWGNNNRFNREWYRVDDGLPMRESPKVKPCGGGEETPRTNNGAHAVYQPF